MKKETEFRIVFFCGVLTGILLTLLTITVAGAGETQNDKEPIYNEIRKLEERIMIPHYIDIVDCPPCPEPEKAEELKEYNPAKDEPTITFELIWDSEKKEWVEPVALQVFEIVIKLKERIKALEKRVKELEDNQIDWGSGVTIRWVPNYEWPPILYHQNTPDYIIE